MMEYIIELKADKGKEKHVFDNEKNALTFINMFDLDQILACYKYDENNDFEPWDDFIPDNNIISCPQCGMLIKINNRISINCECGCEMHLV